MRGEIEKAESVEAVVDGDDHDVAAMAQAFAVVERAVDRAVVVSAAVKVDQHRALAMVAQAGREDVEMQAVFALHAGLRVRRAADPRPAAGRPRLGAASRALASPRSAVSCGARVVNASQTFTPIQGAGGSGAWKRTGAVSAP